MRRNTLCLALFTLLATAAADAESPRFRGPSGDGVFAESGLLTSWPEGGPTMLWSADGMGETYSSVTLGDGRIYTTGMTDER